MRKRMKSKRRVSRNAALVGSAVCCVALALVAGASAGKSRTAAPATVRITAQLTSAQEAPHPAHPASHATGNFTATFEKTSKGYSMVWHLTFANLSGNAASAYIHEGPRGKYGPALFHLCSPCKAGAHGAAYASPSELSLITDGKAYVNVRTVENPKGEIRGQLGKTS
jgi:hypothetical protein